MSQNSSAQSSAFSTSQMQPKFKDCKADFDKSPSTFRTWLRLISGIVRNLVGGDQLEGFLDSHLKRERYIANTRPSFLDHPDLDFGPEPTLLGSPSAQASSAEEGDDESLLSAFASQTQPATSIKYSSLSEEAIRLDKSLFHVLFTIVSGTYLVVISDLTGQFARYTCAIIAMWKHNDLSSSNRRILAMNEMGSLVFHGDASKWKVDFISRTRELYESGATLEHYIMQCAFSSFEGKNSQVQAMITEDINKDDLIKPGMSIEKLANKYASFLATLTSGKQAGKINSVRKKWCKNCDAYGHDTKECKSNATEDEAKGDYKGKKHCDFCDKPGHTEEECFFKEKFDKKLKQLEEKKEGDRPARKVGEDKDAEDGSNSSVMNQVSKAEISRVLEAMSKTLSI